MKKIGLLLALLGALAACAVPADEATAALAPGRDARLTLYTSHKQAVYGPIVKEFQQRTGIWVEVVTGGSGELLERIAVEAEAPACDLMFGGGVESLAAYEQYFEPCTPAGVEYLRRVGRSDEGLWTPFSCLPLVLVYNTRLVSEGELTGWADLLDPRWKGRIAFADPTVSGSSYTAALTLFSCIEGDDWDILAALAANLDGGSSSLMYYNGEQITRGSNIIGMRQMSPAILILN